MRKLMTVLVLLTVGCTAELRSLIKAIDEGDRARVESLISANPDLVNQALLGRRGAMAKRPLHEAAKGGNVEIVTLLLDRGADVSATVVSGETALHFAARWGKGAAVAALLIKRGAVVDARDQGGETPLYQDLNGESVQVLVAAGADVNARNNQGNTPLHAAATYASIGKAVALCAAGADLTARDKEGMTPEGRANTTSVAMVPWMREVCPRLRVLHTRDRVVSDEARVAAKSEYHCYELQAATPDPRNLTSRTFQAQSCSALGHALERGAGVEKDVVRAAKLYQLGCDHGDVRGCGNLATAYEDGTGVARDERKALVLYQKGCDEKDAWSCGRLGHLYEVGRGVARDEAKAASIYAALCEAKDGWACTTLGVMHTQGRGVKPDMARARTLFKQACDAGNQTGCENLKAVQ